VVEKGEARENNRLQIPLSLWEKKERRKKNPLREKKERKAITHNRKERRG